MAKKSAPPARRSGSSALAKMKAKQAMSRARQTAKRASQSSRMYSIATSALVGFGDRRGIAWPTVLGIEPTLVYGALGAFFLPNSAAFQGATTGLLDVAAYKIGAGSPVLRGEDEVGADEGGWADVP